jgi:hypothetical protein
MSILVALAGQGCAVVASDRLRTNGQGGQTQVPGLKVFQHPRGVILGGVVGLVEVNGTPTRQFIEALSLAGCKTLDDVRDTVDQEITSVLNAAANITNRTVDVLVVAPLDLISPKKIGIRGLHFQPNAAGIVSAVRSSFDGFSCVGDPSAMRVVSDAIASTSLANLRLAALRRKGEELVRLGVTSSGAHPSFPQVLACGGAPDLKFRNY